MSEEDKQSSGPAADEAVRHAAQRLSTIFDRVRVQKTDTKTTIVFRDHKGDETTRSIKEGALVLVSEDTGPVVGELERTAATDWVNNNLSLFADLLAIDGDWLVVNL